VNDFALIFGRGEMHRAREDSKQGMVPADFNTDTCMIACAALTHDDIAWDDGFAAKLLDAETLGMRFATVFGTTYTFLVSHDVFLL
jgi:hypothetical protein